MLSPGQLNSVWNFRQDKDDFPTRRNGLLDASIMALFGEDTGLAGILQIFTYQGAQMDENFLFSYSFAGVTGHLPNLNWVSRGIFIGSERVFLVCFMACPWLSACSVSHCLRGDKWSL